MTATIHLRGQIIGRGSGRSVCAAAAYRAAARVADERTGELFDYSRKRGVVYDEVMLPEHAPSQFADRSFLWNAVEAAEKAAKAQLAREIVISLPRELTRDENITLAHDYVQTVFVDAGMIADIAYHDPDKENHNPHVHIMLTMREVRPDGSFAAKSHKEYLCRDIEGNEAYMTGDELKERAGWEKVYTYRRGNERRQLTATEAAEWDGCKRQGKAPVDRKVDANNWNSKDKMEEWREAYARHQNLALERAGEAKRVDHRSFERRGIEQIPEVHMGPAAWHMEQKGIATAVGEKNRQIRDHNKILRNPAYRDKPECAELRQEIYEHGMDLRETTFVTAEEVRDVSRPFLIEVRQKLAEIVKSVAARISAISKERLAELDEKHARQEAPEAEQQRGRETRQPQQPARDRDGEIDMAKVPSREIPGSNATMETNYNYARARALNHIRNAAQRVMEHPWCHTVRSYARLLRLHGVSVKQDRGEWMYRHKQETFRASDVGAGYARAAVEAALEAKSRGADPSVAREKAAKNHVAIRNRNKGEKKPESILAETMRNAEKTHGKGRMTPEQTSAWIAQRNAQRREQNRSRGKDDRER